MRNTLRMADVMMIQLFLVSILAVAKYCTQIYHANTRESLNAKITAAERTQRNRLSPNVWDAPDVASGTEAIIAAINTSRKPRTSPIRPPDSSSVSTRLSFNAGPQVSYRSASDQPAGPSEPDAATPSSSSSTQRSLVTPEGSLREAVRSGRPQNLKAALDRGNARYELMAQNAEGGAGLLMLAAGLGKVSMFDEVSTTVQRMLGTKMLARQLRYEDDEGKPLLFYAASSRKVAMVRSVVKLLEKTIGRFGLDEQITHLDDKGSNLLMQSCNDPEVFEVVWDLLTEKDSLVDQLSDTDKDSKDWLLHAAESGNVAALRKLELISETWQREGNRAPAHDTSGVPKWVRFVACDTMGWNGYMYAARLQTPQKLQFLTQILRWCEEEENEALSHGLQPTIMLMHAAIGGHLAYTLVCDFMRKKGHLDWVPSISNFAVLLSCAARGGDVLVLNMVAGGLKTETFPDGSSEGPWYAVEDGCQEHSERLAQVIGVCARRGTAVSLFLSAIRSGSVEMIKVVVMGINTHITSAKDRWETLCGVDGNPLTAAASVSVHVFQETLKALKDTVNNSEGGEALKDNLRMLLLPVENQTPLYSAISSDSPELFDVVLRSVRDYMRDIEATELTSAEMFRQVSEGMQAPDESEGSKWISAMMLPRVLQAMQDVDRGNDSVDFDVTVLDDFVKAAVKQGAFDHIRILVKNGCDLVTHFPALLNKIGIHEMDVGECMILAITTSSNPFVECGIASQAMYGASIARNKNRAALGRLQDKILEISLELLEHLPHTVSAVGNELARGVPDLETFVHIKKIKPEELLGYVVVGWILEGCGERQASGGGSDVGGNPLVQAVRSGPQAMELLSEPLVLDYLGLKFTRTLPAWNTQHPFERNINQAFYSYNLVDSERQCQNNEVVVGTFQRLLLLLQGWSEEDTDLPSTSALPGLQFTLAGIIGKPVSYYVVPAIRMAFVVMSYLAMICLYLSCVALRSKDIPANEWIFYIYMAAVAWRETLEFINARMSEPGSEPGVGASIERYFYDKWNFLDVSTIFLVAAAFIFRMVEWASGELRHLFLAQVLLAVSAPLLFSRVLFLSQIGSTLGPMTQVIFQMLTQLGQFSVVLMLVMLGFAICFNALYGSGSLLVEAKLDTCDKDDHPITAAFGTVGQSLLTMFESMLGEFSFEAFYASYEDEDGQDCGGVSFQDSGIILMVIYLVIMAVMLLNLLIAVLSTAHATVDQNADKEYHLARAKIILQSGEDVSNDVLPPPFNLLKPFLGLAWPSSGKDPDRWWDITTGALHRLIFAVVVGLAAVALSTVLWVLSLPLVSWRMARWLSRHLETCTENTSWDMSRGRPGLHRTIIRRRHQPRLGNHSISHDCHSDSADEDDEEEEQMPRLSRQSSLAPVRKGSEADLKRSIERIFFGGSEAATKRVSVKKLGPLLWSIAQFIAGAALASVFCCVIYPMLSLVLWVRGLACVVEYVQNARAKRSPMERQQANLGEEGEWHIARGHAITRNKRYMSRNSSEDEFNVDALLKTTTGMTMEDLRHNMTNLKSVRRRRALESSVDLLLKKYPTDDPGMTPGSLGNVN